MNFCTNVINTSITPKHNTYCVLTVLYLNINVVKTVRKFGLETIIVLMHLCELKTMPIFVRLKLYKSSLE